MSRSRAMIDAYRVRAHGWLTQRSRREQMLLAVLGGVLMTTALVGLVIRPLHAMRAGAFADIRAYDMLAARMQQARALPVAAAPLRTGDATAIVQASASQFGLLLHGVASERSGVRVQLTGVAYEAVVRWLADLAQTSDLRVRRLTLVHGATAGTIDATLVLAP